MKKALCFLICCAFLLLSGSGGKSQDELIAGSWKVVSVNGIVRGEQNPLSAEDYENQSAITTFHSDGTLSGFSSVVDTNYSNIRWHMDGKNLIISQDGTSITYSIIKLDESILIIRVELDEMDSIIFNSGDYMEAVYERVN